MGKTRLRKNFCRRGQGGVGWSHRGSGAGAGRWTGGREMVRKLLGEFSGDMIKGRAKVSR